MPKPRGEEQVTTDEHSWLRTGYDAVKDHIDNVERGRVKNIWMKEGETRILRFIENMPKTAYRHTLKVGKYWKNYTCLKELGQECPLCDAGLKRGFRGGYTVIDRTPDKDGRLPKPEACVFDIPTNSLKLFERCNNKYGLLGRDIEVTRIGSGAQTIYTPQPEDKRALTEEESKLEPIDFSKIWKPLTKRELLSIIAHGEDDDENDGSDDEKGSQRETKVRF